ncbi:MAG: TOBE domain-containing protein [Deltaproteobacteria bacterium]|nr:TOBE domain-containing protein [Deltaproteobacteria bacterium]
MKLSARNILKGIIKQITPGAINTDVVLDVGNGIDIVAQISKNSVDHLGLAVGKPAYAMINIDDIIIGVDD